MPLALLLLGALFLTAAVRGNKCGGEQCADVLFKTIKDDFTGPDNFIYWGLALFLIGAAGYYKPLKPLSNAFLTLVIIVLFISNRGFFAKFMEQIGATQSAQTVNADFGSVAMNLVSGNTQPAKQAGNSLWDKYKNTFSQSGVSIVAKVFKF